MGRDGAKFVVQELLPASATYRGGDPARFEWDAEHHDMPLGPWTLGTTLRTKRTDYSGGDAVTEQVLGSSHKPFTLAGRWSDKWREPGYAEVTRLAFEKMVQRGNLVRLEFKGASRVGLITDFDADVAPPKRPFEVHYRFTLSAHRSGDAAAQRPRSPRTTLDPKTHQLQLRQAIEPIDVSAPPNLGGSALSNDILGLARDFNNSVLDIEAAVDAAVLAPLEDVANAMTVLANSFAIARGRAQSLLDRLGGVRSSASGAQTAFSLASMDAWIRGLAVQARKATDIAFRAEDDLVRRARPDVLTIHEARRNESMYDIAIRYYGTPDGWRVIAQRNNLDSFTMQGGELLVIPEGPRR